MRAIKFRAKRIDNDKWVFGNLECHGNDLRNPDRVWITTTEPISDYRESMFLICPETLGQWTGLKDINGVDIYEGDIDSKGMVFTYDTDMGGWYRMLKGEGVQWHGQAVLNGKLPFEIIGNIHDDNQEADYMLLGRLQMDCLYNIGQGAILRLHQKTVTEQISKMRVLLSGLIVKPEWISEEDILKFEEGLKALDLKTVHKTKRLHGNGYGPLCEGSGTYRSENWESVDCPDCLAVRTEENI